MITVKIKNVDRVAKAISRYPTLSVKHLDRAIKNSLIKIQRRAMKKAPVDTGLLRARWNMSVNFLRGVLKPESKYATFVEYGTKPHWVGIKHLEGWARRHGISPFTVQSKIAKKGTKAQPFLEPAVNEREINNEIDIALDKILKEL